MTDDVMRKDLTPDDPRPDGKPFYIDTHCPCGTALVLADVLNDPNVASEDIWHDEWTCPKCRDGVWMDWPQVQQDELEAAVKEVRERFAAEDVGASVDLTKKSRGVA